MVPEPAARTIHTNHFPAGNETWWSSLASHLVPLFPASKPSFLLYLNLSRGDVFHHDSKFIRIHGNQRLSELGLSGDKDGLDFSSRSDAAIDGELNWFIKTESWIPASEGGSGEESRQCIKGDWERAGLELPVRAHRKERIPLNARLKVPCSQVDGTDLIYLYFLNINEYIA